MSRSAAMLRTRRRDNNVKPNRRLDRKSSRGMIYENEELRLRTININAEVERGQSDIKKLRRENEMLKKEIWCLRDGYDKLERLIKEKGIDSSSSSTSCSSSDSESSCSSCTEESQEVETSQNFENVQKTNLKNLHSQFDHLSVVPEENSENSEKNSNRASLPNDPWACGNECDVIKPDQSYPDNIHKSSTLPTHFAPISPSKSYDGYCNTLFPYGENVESVRFPDYQQTAQHFSNFDQEMYTTQRNVSTDAKEFYQNMILVPKPSTPTSINPMDKSSTDLIVKMDNQNFINTPSQSTFSNGGNLEELLNDIEAISQDILKISTIQNTSDQIAPPMEGSDIVNKIQNTEMSYVQNSRVDNLELPDDEQRPYKSEISVVLMPTPMPLIGFDKYRNLQKSCESLTSMSASKQDLRIIPDAMESQNVLIKTPSTFAPGSSSTQPIQQSPSLPDNKIALNNLPNETSGQSNPFFFGNLRDSYFNSRYNPDNFGNNEETKGKSDSKSNLIEPVKNEPETSKSETVEAKVEESKKEDKSLSIKRKVSIHFKGKKEKSLKSKLDAIEVVKPTKSGIEKRLSIFDLRFDRKGQHQKTPSMESKKSEANQEAKTPTSSDSKASKTSSSSDVKTPEIKPERTMSLPNCDAKNGESKVEKKVRKSISVSPDRKHVHMKEDGGKKCHKKHRRGDRSRARRSSISTDRFLRERSFSVCTDRSNILDHRLGLGWGSSYLYDDYNSDRERTNSLSSCDTIKTRKMSNMSNVPVNGKIPWCACWGNGCL